MPRTVKENYRHLHICTCFFHSTPSLVWSTGLLSVDHFCKVPRPQPQAQHREGDKCAAALMICFQNGCHNSYHVTLNLGEMDPSGYILLHYGRSLSFVFSVRLPFPDDATTESDSTLHRLSSRRSIMCGARGPFSTTHLPYLQCPLVAVDSNVLLVTPSIKK